MKFLEKPLGVYDNVGNLYYLKKRKKWGKLWILQEPGGNYEIINESSSWGWRDFPYKRVKVIGEKYLLAFWNKEIQKGTYFHMHNKNGKLSKIIGRRYKIYRRQIIIDTIDGNKLKMYFN